MMHSRPMIQDWFPERAEVFEAKKFGKMACDRYIRFVSDVAHVPPHPKERGNLRLSSSDRCRFGIRRVAAWLLLLGERVGVRGNVLLLRGGWKSSVEWT